MRGWRVGLGMSVGCGARLIDWLKPRDGVGRYRCNYKSKPCKFRISEVCRRRREIDVPLYYSQEVLRVVECRS